MDLASALERSAALVAKVNAMESAVASNPEDKGLRITLLSARRTALRAEQHLMALAEQSSVDLCRYRVVRTENVYPAAAFAQSIVAYQDLFTSLCDFVENGAKAVARYSDELRAESTLNVGYTYPGSLGVLFTIENERDLFNEGGLDKVISSLNDLMDIDSISQVREAAQIMGINVVRKTYKWAERNWDAEYSLDINWNRSDSVVSGRRVSRNQFLKLKSLIIQTEDEEPDDLELVGTLVGYNVLSDHFAFTTSNGDTYSGRLAENFLRMEYTIPKEYKALIRKKTVTNYATDVSKSTYDLLELDSLYEAQA